MYRFLLSGLLMLAFTFLPPAALAGAEDLAPAGACPGADGTAGPAPEQVNAMRCLIDYARGEHGLRALPSSEALEDSARLKAEAEVRCDEFSHTACGDPLTHTFKRAGYINPGYRWKVGENLAYGRGTAASPRGVMAMWLASPPHRANLLSAKWREQGVALLPQAVLMGQPGTAVWVSHFGARNRAGASAARRR